MEDYLVNLFDTVCIAVCIGGAVFVFAVLGWTFANALGLPGNAGILGGDGLLAFLALIALLRTMTA